MVSPNGICAIALFMTCQVIDKVTTEHCGNTDEYSVSGMMLKGHIFKKITGAPFGDVCLRECRHDVRCQSFNYVFNQDICELSNRTKEARREDFVPNSERYYFRRDRKRVRLGSIYELPAESCREIKASEGGQAVSGKYWLHFAKIGRTVFVHCNMATEDVDECSASEVFCDVNAICQNTRGSYGCSCKTGFSGNGKTCTDIDECAASIRVCDINATCQNTRGSYGCSCKTGFSGDGKTCSDIDECTASIRVCDVNANCQNTRGSYGCSCKTGFSGNRKTCTAPSFRATFINLGASGRYGPAGGSYTGQNHEGQVTLSGGIQLWTVPHNGDYRIEAIGAAGGYGQNSSNGQYRGRGARMTGTFTLSKGEVIRILVGQEGGINHADYAAGGGGGTFVVRGSNTPLIIAGGGGGMEQANSRYPGCDASIGTKGNPGHKSWSGGSNGNGAQIADDDNSGGGGGGFYSSGRSSKDFGGTRGKGGEGGKGFLQGGVGGRALGNNAVGGFGGGAGAYGIGGGGGAGGGGGYSGGSSGDNEVESCGGGGGSYNTGRNKQQECCYNTAGHGQVTVTLQ